MKNFNFGEAIEALKQGKKVARKGWNGKGKNEFDRVPWLASQTDILAEDWMVVE